MEDPLTQDHHIVWESGGQWWTDYPPPPGFDGEESEGEGDGRGYRRTLSPAEQAVVDSDLAGERALAEAQRDAYFGFVPDTDADGDGDQAAARPHIPITADPRTARCETRADRTQARG